jgi:hypothetical protein
MSTASRWAVLSGVAGLAANVLLILFFALVRPWTVGVPGFDWLGPANDVVVVVQFAALVPVALAVRGRLRVGSGVTAAAVAAMVAVVALQLALLGDLLAFGVQVWLVTACLVVTFGWVLVASRAGRAVLPRGAVRLGTAIGVGFPVGGAVFATGLLLPGGSAVQYAVCGLGVVVGVVGWLSFPVWPLLARRVLLEES